MKPARRRIGAVLFLVFFMLIQVVVAAEVFARAGGGGSDSGSDFGSSSFSSSSDWDSDRSGSRSSTSGDFNIGDFIVGVVLVIVFFIVVVIGSIRAEKQRAKLQGQREIRLVELGKSGPGWEKTALEARATEVFHAFQKAWAELDLKTMETLLSKEYYKRMVLELAALDALKRRNAMEEVRIYRVEFLDFGDWEGEDKDWFEVSISAGAKDSIIETTTGRVLFTDRNNFTENWTFVRDAGIWKLDLIKQTTAAARFIEGKISDFAKRNGFYYDPDFGWLMIPDKGAIFGEYGFGKADINNHVIGHYRNKVVEFYTYRPKTGDSNIPNYLVAQAILPISYNDILVRKKVKGWFSSQPKPKGLNQMSLEYGDFNEKFEVFAHPEDQISSLELLTPNFMVKIYDLPFELNIEVVGHVLYLYTARRDVSYDQMLEVLSWAFDDMKM